MALAVSGPGMGVKVDVDDDGCWFCCDDDDDAVVGVVVDDWLGVLAPSLSLLLARTGWLLVSLLSLSFSSDEESLSQQTSSSAAAVVVAPFFLQLIQHGVPKPRYQESGVD